MVGLWSNTTSEKVRTGSLGQPLHALPTADARVDEKECRQIASVPEALLGEVDLPCSERFVTNRLPLGLGPDRRRLANELERNVQVV